MTDWQLLQKFADDNSQAAFAEICRRYTSLVYRVCQRELGESSLAEDAAQAVFLLLARKAPSLKPGRADSLSPWLFQAALLTAKNARRQEQRRQAHELEAAQMQTQHSAGTPEWAEVEPLLNAALQALPAGQRTILLERYFQGRPLVEVGMGLGISEDAARMRVNRALDRLRRWFAARNIALSAAALASLLPLAVRPAPAHAAEAISRLALPTSGGSTAAHTLAQGVFHAMNLHRLKLQLGAVALVAVFVFGTAGAVRVTTQMKVRRVAAEQQQSSAQALAIMNQMYATYAAMKSFKCNVVSSDLLTKDGTVKIMQYSEFEVENPNKMRLHRTTLSDADESGQMLAVSDGRNLYVTCTENHGLADRYLKTSIASDTGTSSPKYKPLALMELKANIPESGPIELGAGMPSIALGVRLHTSFNPRHTSYPQFLDPEYSVEKLSVMNFSGLGFGVPVDIVVARIPARVTGQPNSDVSDEYVTYYIGQKDHLLYELTVGLSPDPAAVGTRTETYYNRETNSELSPTDFTFTPPSGSHEVQDIRDLDPRSM